jgi:iron complex outermembrane receptor protein
MKKWVLLGVLLLDTSLLLAQDLMEIEITSGIRSSQPEVRTPNQINVITREAIESSGATTVTDVLRGRAGLQITDLRGDGASTTISLRGFAQTANANVLVLVDGRRLNHVDTRNPDIGHISLNDVEQIEVTQGSAGVLYGNQAVGGVVNIITRKPGARHIKVDADVGSYDRRSARFSASERHDNGFAYRLSAETLRTDGYRDHSSRDFRNLSGHLSYTHDTGNVFVDLQHAEDDLELPGALVQAELDADRRSRNAGFADDFSDSTSGVVRLGLQQALSSQWSLEGELTYRDTDEKLTQSFRNSPSPDGGNTRRDQLSLNPRLIGNVPTRNGNAQFTVGIDAEQTDFSMYIPASFFPPFVTITNRSNDQDTEAAYAQAVLPLSQDIELTIGGRYASVDNKMVDDGTFGAFPAGIDADDDVFVKTLGLNYRPDKHWRFYARLDENFRFAKVDEFTLALPGEILDTQTGLTMDVGVAWSSGNAFFNLGVYRLELDDEIYYDPTVGLFGANTNLDETLRRGAVISGGLALTDQLFLSGDFTYTHARFDDGGLEDQYISGVSPRLATLRVQYQPDPRWDVQSELQLVSSKYAQGDNLNSQPKAAGYGVLNLTARYQQDNWDMQFKINNVTDKQYSEFISDAAGVTRGYQPSPERNFLMTLGYEFH